VRFNTQNVESLYFGDNLIEAAVASEFLQGKGSIMVDVVNAAGTSNAIPVPIDKPTAELNVFFCYHPWITREIQLLLLIIFAGALGSYLHATMSVTDFIGSRKLVASWFWWYITRPFLGMAMGLIFYAVLRGGFLAGSPADANVVNPFGVLAIGALVGMFSDKAATKLGEIFDVVFRSSVTRPDKMGDELPLISKLEPATIVAGGTEPVIVKITGERLGKVSLVKVNKVDRLPESVSEKEVSFKLNPDDIAQAGQIEIIAVNPGGILSDPAIINVSEPTATTDALPLISGVEPATISAGGAEPVVVKITGQRMAAVSKVQVNKVDRVPDSVSEQEVSFTLNPEDTAQPGQIEIIAVNPDGSSPPAVLTVSEAPPPGGGAKSTTEKADTSTTGTEGTGSTGTTEEKIEE
jgi:hypothetical protein